MFERSSSLLPIAAPVTTRRTKPDFACFCHLIEAPSWPTSATASARQKSAAMNVPCFSVVLILFFAAASEVDAQAYGKVDVAAAAEAISHILRNSLLCQKRMLNRDVVFIQESIEV